MRHVSRLSLSLTATLTLAAAAAAQDAVLRWNDAALAAVRRAATPPPPASRFLAILHAALFDAVNGVAPGYHHYLVAPAAAAGASAEAAATQAAHDALVALYPAQATAFDALNDTILAGIAGGQAKSDGIAWGTHVAHAVLAARANDGSANTAPYPGSNQPGQWRPHLSFGGLIRPALPPLWGQVQPFAVPSTTRFLPPPPPTLTSPQYAIEVRLTQALGAHDGSRRTADQTEAAQFWASGPGTSTPAGHWNTIAAVVAHTRGGSLLEHARLFALLNLALADAAIVCWDCKYHYGFWRPITAIQLADQDGNRHTQPDPHWMPLLETPPFPEYTSGHSTFSAAAAVILALFHGRDNIRFTVGSDDLPNVTRTYHRFSEAAWESGLSRIYGGIHFMSANLHGLACGAEIGQYTWTHYLRPLHR